MEMVLTCKASDIVSPQTREEQIHRMWYFSCTALSVLVGWQERQQVCKKVLVYCWWWFDWRFACLIAPTVSTIPVLISSSKIQNAGILVPAYPGCPGKRLLNKCCWYFWLLKCKIYRNLFRFAKVVERSLLPHFYEPQFSADYMTYE